jgi:hypothetical protein
MNEINSSIPPTPRTKAALEFSSFQIFFSQNLFRKFFSNFLFLSIFLKKNHLWSLEAGQNLVPHFFPTKKPEWSGYQKLHQPLMGINQGIKADHHGHNK